jgi:small subunit ribosomal protein S8
MKHNIWNMFASIQNGQLANKLFILQKKTKLCSLILNILWDEGYILGYKIENKHFKVFLRYKNNNPVISSLKSISKPGNRIYYTCKQIWKINSSKGLIILSTNKGLLTLMDCKKKKVGGEPLVVIK